MRVFTVINICVVMFSADRWVVVSMLSFLLAVSARHVRTVEQFNITVERNSTPNFASTLATVCPPQYARIAAQVFHSQ